MMTRVGMIVALAGVATMVAALGFLHLARTGLSALRDPVSGYALTRYRSAYTVAAGAAAAVASSCSRSASCGRCTVIPQAASASSYRPMR